MRLDQALKDIESINRARINGISIHEYYSYGRFSLWSCIQMHAWSLLVERDPSLPEISFRKPPGNPLKLWILKSFIVAESILALIWYLVRRPRVLVYSPDIVVGSRRCDIRIGQVYAFLENERVAYGEIIHTPLRRTVLTNFFRRRRPVIYIEALYILFPFAWIIGHHSSFDMVGPDDIMFLEGENRGLARLVSDLSRHIPRLEFAIRVLSRAMYLIGIRTFIMIDDSRYWGLLMIAARDAKVQTIAVQHGRFSKYLPGYRNIALPPERCPAPDRYILWNEFWRDRLMRLSETFMARSNHLIIGGRPHEYQGRPAKYGGINDGITTIVIPFEPHTPFASIGFYVSAFLRCSSVVVVYKVRQDVSLSQQLSEISDDIGQNSKFTVVAELGNIASKIDIVAGTYSTFLYEMAEAGVPVIVLHTPETQADDLVEAGFAESVSDPSDIGRALETVMRQDPAARQRRAQQLAVTIPIQETLHQLFKKTSLS